MSSESLDDQIIIITVDNKSDNIESKSEKEEEKNNNKINQNNELE